MPQRRRSLFGYDPEPGRPEGGVKEPLSVSELNRIVRTRLESDFPRVEVRGEISNFTRAVSGHLYFSLKDDGAQVAAVMWRSQVGRFSEGIEDGVEVVARGRISLYEPRGNYQIIVESLRLEGRGALEARFLALKERFEKAGYFDPERKQPLPFLPEVIGIVTSPVGAAVHDLTRTILDRFSKAHIRIVPVRVQGEGSAEEIAAAIDRLDSKQLCDVMIVGRGGGSLEDLWAFNEEAVIEAIHRSRTPVISAVGHETDVTLADLVADHRALTPTAAGEAVVPILEDLVEELDDLGRGLRRSIGEQLRGARSELDALGKSWALREPINLLRRAEQQLDDLRRRQGEALRERLRLQQRRLDQLASSPALADPRHRLSAERGRIEALALRAGSSIRARLAAAAAELEREGRMLTSLSPLAVLERGYSITRDEGGRVIRRAQEAGPGQILRTMLGDGELRSRVEAEESDDPA